MFNPMLYLATHQTVERKTPATGPGSTSAATQAELKVTIDRQNLIIQALLMLLMEKKVFDEFELKKWIDYVDQLDGRPDGKLTQDKSPTKCPACGRVSPANAPRCIYCNSLINESVIDRRAEAQNKKEPPTSR